MRICHLISGDLWAGAEVQAYTLMRSLKTVPGLDLDAIVLNEGRLYERLCETGIDVSIVREKQHGFFAIKSIISRRLRGQSIDILHTHRYKENVIGGLVRGRSAITGLVQTVHGMQEELHGLKSLKMKFYMSLNDDLTRRRFSKIIAVSNEIKRRLDEKFGEKKVVTIHNAVDADLIEICRTAEEIKRELGIGGNQIVVGSAGRLVPVKAYDSFLKAAVIILRKRPNTAFVIVGDGPLGNELKKSAAELGIGANVIFTGFRDDVLDLVNALDVFVVSSIHEGIPMSALEAMAMNKVVVSTAVGGMPEIIEDNVSGLLAKPGSPEALAERCLAVIEDRKLRSDIEKNARARIEQKFSVERQRDQVLRLYKEVISQS